MKLNYFGNQVLTAGRWLATSLFCVATVAFVWLGGFSLSVPAIASPTTSLIAADLGDQIKGAADDVRAGSKDLIRDTEGKVKKTANKNAAKVDRADEDGGAAETKAKRDKSRIEKRASEDAERTETAVDKSMNAVKGAVDNIKDAFGK
ncbi:hypothetical protein ACKFKG_12190 [Phormidesmis sp. 146-35]